MKTKCSSILILIPLILMSGKVLAESDYLAEVISFEGKVFQKRSHSISSSTIQMGTKLNAKARLVIGSNSFLRLKFKEGTIATFSSRTNVRLLHSSDGAPFIELLSGRVRVKSSSEESESKQEGKYTFFLKTLNTFTATKKSEFVALFNPLNSVSGILSLKGLVKMARIEANFLSLDVESNDDISIEIERGRKTVELKRSKTRLLELREKMAKVLGKKNVVIVNSGQYSSSLDAFKGFSQPTRISPIQLELVNSNKDLSDNFTLRKKTYIDGNSFKGATFKLAQAGQEYAAEGTFDLGRKIYTPKAGGFVDFKTGYYIAPDANAEFKKSKAVYLPGELGRLEQSSGNYLAPKGLTLLPTVGFQLSKFKKVSPEKKKNILSTKSFRTLNGLKKLRDKLNEGLKLTLFQDESKSSISGMSSIKVDSVKEIYNRGEFTFTVKQFSEKIDHTNVTNGFANKQLDESSARSYGIDYGFKAGRLWKPNLSFNYSIIDFDSTELTAVEQPSKRLYSLGAGVQFLASNRWNLFTRFKIDQELFVDFGEGTNGVLTRVALSQSQLGVSGRLIEFSKGRLSLDAEVFYSYSFSKDKAAIAIDGGSGYGASSDFKYWPKQNYWLSLGYHFEKESRSLISSTSNSDVSHTHTGFQLKVGSIF